MAWFFKLRNRRKMSEKKTSQEILPVEERLKTVAVIGTNAGRTVAQQIAMSDKEPLLRRYHKALEASEQRVKELEAEIEKSNNEKFGFIMRLEDSEQIIHELTTLIDIYKSKSRIWCDRVQEYIDEMHENGLAFNHRISDFKAGVKQDDIKGIKLWVNQTTNGGMTGDDFAGTVYIDLGDDKYLAIDYSM